MVAEIYSTPSCGQCVVAKNLMKSNNIEYTEHIIGQTATKDDVEDRCDCTVKSVPQIFINDEYVGSLKELQSYISRMDKM